MERINVTKTFMPPIEEVETYLQEIWERGQVTNQGPLLLKFETEVSAYLGISNFHFVTNGTIALQLALRALGITSGEVITTPFSYVATTSTILWEHCEPVFVDIDTETFCIDADKIEAAITDKTKAIMAVHVFGNPCEVEKIEVIAAKHDLKVIYDAAHAFGVEYKGRSLLDYGDISTCSFHATKVFHTIEGGAVIVKDRVISDQVELMKRFGHNGDDHLTLGINAKATELNAAIGLVNLRHVNELIEKRKQLHEVYSRLLGNRFQHRRVEGVKSNYAYYPIVTADEDELFKIIDRLAEHSIFPRRYFYPSLNTLPYLESRQSCPISEDIAKHVLCLPLYPELSEENVKKICEVVLQ